MVLLVAARSHGHRRDLSSGRSKPFEAIPQPHRRSLFPNPGGLALLLEDTTKRFQGLNGFVDYDAVLESAALMSLCTTLSAGYNYLPSYLRRQTVAQTPSRECRRLSARKVPARDIVPTMTDLLSVLGASDMVVHLMTCSCSLCAVGCFKVASVASQQKLHLIGAFVIFRFQVLHGQNFVSEC